jgi:hypothetical protein
MRLLCKVLAFAILTSSSVLATRADADGTVAPAPATLSYDAAVRATKDKVTGLRALAGELEKAADEPAPAKLTSEQLAEVKKYDAWIRGNADRLQKLASSWDAKVAEVRTTCEKTPTCNKVTTAKTISETNMSFNLQYLQLQSQMQHENRSYTAVSNIMKTKHDTVKNSISNIR